MTNQKAPAPDVRICCPRCDGAGEIPAEHLTTTLQAVPPGRWSSTRHIAGDLSIGRSAAANRLAALRKSGQRTEAGEWVLEAGRSEGRIAAHG